MKVLIFLFLTVSAEQLTPFVKLPLGNLEGDTKESFNGRMFYSFEGVPYAHPPVGEYRFKEPLPVKPWQDTWVAKTIYKCMQYNQYTPPGGDFVIGDEDCLYLNIYTPTLNHTANLDTIVYIHGGAFMFNYGGLHGPEYLMDKDVVYINLNYRLGPLGFLSTESEVVPGNNGIKDQIQALKWIKDNIRYFGGNPDSVTIMGMSAGGASVHLHYLSPKSKGLFQRGISQSGSALNHWVLMEEPLAKTKKIAITVGCPTTDLQGLVECLRKRPARQIVDSVQHFQPWLYNPFSPFGVVIDSWSDDPVLPDHPYKLIKNKQVSNLPWIISHTNSEGLYPAADFYIDEQYLKDIDTRWNELIPHILDYNFTVDLNLHDQISQKIRKYYLGEKEVSRSTYMEFVKILSDRHFIVDLHKTARLQAAAVNSPIYMYYFTYRGAHSKSEARSGTNKDFGACHGDDTTYVLKTPVDSSSNERDRRMVKLVLDMFTSFAKTGKPGTPIEWPSLSGNADDLLVRLKIESPEKLTVEKISYENSKFWESLPIKENEKLFHEMKDEL